jgi:hypothetical protein
MIVRMTGFPTPAAPRAASILASAVAVVALALVALLAAESALADLTLAPRPRGESPMRILRVTSVDPACQPNCPEWISAEGTVTPGETQDFAKVIADLGGRRLPILISSNGGSVRDALAMGLLIRSKGLVVAVARTLIANCPERARDCPGARGRAIVGAHCASACSLILAGGVERLVGPVPQVGVHQITAVERGIEGVEHLTTVKKIYEPSSVDRTVQAYLRAMGVGDPVMEILRKTPAASIRWLSPAELRESHLATGVLDAAAPILTGGANGLNSHAFNGEPPAPDLILGRVSEPFAAPTRSGGMTLEATFAYRRGGGVVGASVAARDGDMKTVADPSPDGWTLTLTGGGEPGRWKAGGSPQARAMIPRERFCALARGGALVAAPAGPVAGEPAQSPMTFDLAAAGGVSAVVVEACP